MWTLETWFPLRRPHDIGLVHSPITCVSIYNTYIWPVRPTDPQKKASPLNALAPLVPPGQICMLHHYIGTGRRHKWLKGKWFRPTLTRADIPVTWPTGSGADSGSCRQKKVCMCMWTLSMIPIAQAPWHRTCALSNYMCLDLRHVYLTCAPYRSPKKGKSFEGFGNTGSAWPDFHVTPLCRHRQEAQVAQRQVIQAHLDASRYSQSLGRQILPPTLVPAGK